MSYCQTIQKMAQKSKLTMIRSIRTAIDAGLNMLRDESTRPWCKDIFDRDLSSLIEIVCHPHHRS